MSYRIECIPNVSTADPVILERIAAAIEATEGVTLHFVDPGKSTNRTVFTYLGSADQVLKATDALFTIALSEIDMCQHQGVHPRMGAVDVCPFVLLDDETHADDLLERVRTFAQAMSTKHDLAIYGYEHLASSPERKNLQLCAKESTKASRRDLLAATSPTSVRRPSPRLLPCTAPQR